MRNFNLNCECGITFVTPIPSDVVWFTRDDFQGEMDELLELARVVVPPKIVFDLERTDWINGTFLGLFARLLLNLKDRSGSKLGVCNVSSQIREIFDLTRYSVIVDLFASREEALAAWGDPEI